MNLRWINYDKQTFNGVVMDIKDEKVSLKQFLALLPKHECAMHLDHNDHKNSYEKASKWIEDNEIKTYENI